MAFAVVPPGLEAFSAAQVVATAGSADNAAHLTSATTVLGPVGARYLAAYGPAQASNFAATLAVAGLHADAAATETATASFAATDRW
jgi:hypothetical protein